MSRLSATNDTEVEKTHLHEVVMVKLEFDTPVYVHSGIGTITFDSNDYLGVGDFGAVGQVRESERLGPSQINLTLSGIDSALVTEALDSGNYGDPVTIYDGYRQDDGTLVADPWIVARGTYDHAALTRGDDNSISIVIQHDLAVIDENDGSKFSDEDQRQFDSADEFFEYVDENATIKLLWGGRDGASSGSVRTGSRGDPSEPPPQLR